MKDNETVNVTSVNFDKLTLEKLKRLQNKTGLGRSKFLRCLVQAFPEEIFDDLESVDDQIREIVREFFK